MTLQNEDLHFWNDDGNSHCVNMCFESNDRNAQLTVIYKSGNCSIEAGSVVVRWSAHYEPPNDYDPGNAAICQGRIDLEIASLRGIGLGSLLMQPLINWIKKHTEVPIQPINLEGRDAKTIEARDIRNGFYEKLGFVFDYEEEKSWGESKILQSTQLVVPEFKLSNGWHVEPYESKIFIVPESI